MTKISTGQDEERNMTPEEQEVFGTVPTVEQELQERREKMILTPCQFLDGLEAVGKMAEAKAIVANAPYQVKNKFNRATQYERLHPMIIQFGAQLWPIDTDAELDNFFTLAYTL